MGASSPDGVERGVPQYSVVSLAVHPVADLLGQDDLDAGCLLEAAVFREVDPTADLVSV